MSASKIIILVLVVLVGTMILQNRSRAQESDNFESLMDSSMDSLADLPSLENALTWSGDPFFKKPGFSPDGPEPAKIELQSIIFDHDNSAALINGQMFSIGSFVKNHQIMDIGPNYIVLKRGRYLKEFTLPYYEPSESAQEIVEDTL